MKLTAREQAIVDHARYFVQAAQEGRPQPFSDTYKNLLDIIERLQMQGGRG